MIKNFDSARDIVNSLSVVNEVISVGGSIFSSSTGEPNVKKTNHWLSGTASGSYYHALYSANYSASTAVELVDVTIGFSHSSSFYLSGQLTTKPINNIAEKNRVYKLFAKQLLGSEKTIFSINGVERNELIFLTIRRSQFKDEIKKGSVTIETIYSGSGVSGPAGGSIFNTAVVTDTPAVTAYSKGERGDVGNLITGSSTSNVVGQVFYQAGVIVLVPELVSCTSSLSTNPGNTWSGSLSFGQLLATGSTFNNTIDGVRYRFRTLNFTNQSNLHSTYYFCRALNDEFNYSSNPTFVDTEGRIIPTSGTSNLSTRTYITKVGLYGENSELLAVSSLSKPIKKTPDTEFVIKVRLDY